MLTRIILFSLTLLRMTLGLAAPLEEVSLTEALPKASKFELDLVVSAEQVKDSKHRTQGTYQETDLSITYSANKKTDLRFFMSAVMNIENRSKQAIELRADIAEFMFRRKTRLPLAIKMDLELKTYYQMDKETRLRYGLKGAFIPQVVFKKNMTKGMALEVKGRRHFYFNNTSRKSALESENRLYLTGSYHFARQWLFSTQLKFRDLRRKGEAFSYRTHSVQAQKTRQLEGMPSLSYFIGHQALFQIYLSTKLYDKNKKGWVRTQWRKEAVFGTSLMLSIF